LTYRSFATPQVLLLKLIERYNVPTPKYYSDDNFKRTKNSIQMAVIQVIKLWATQYVGDLNTEMRYYIKEFLLHVQRTKNINIFDSVRNHLELQSSLTRKASFSIPPPPAKLPKNMHTSTLTLEDIPKIEIARQFTVLDYELFKFVAPSELVNTNWVANFSNSNPKLKAPNVVACIDRFNNVSMWVVSCILREDRLKKRVKTISRFYKIMEHLIELNNFHSLMAMYAGMNHFAVGRLKWSFESLPSNIKKIQAEVSNLLDNSNSYFSYREALKKCASSTTPCIPFLGIHLQHLLVIEDSNPEKLSHLINFYKCQLISNIIADLKQFQEYPYNLQKVTKLYDLIQNLPIFSTDEKSLHNLSFALEPRGALKNEIQ